MGYGIKRVPPIGSGLKSILTILTGSKERESALFLDLAVEIPALGHFIGQILRVKLVEQAIDFRQAFEQLLFFAHKLFPIRLILAFDGHLIIRRLLRQ